MLKNVFLLIVSLCLFSLPLQGRTLKVAFGESRPPFVFTEQGELRGIEIDILREALLQSGYKIEYTTLPSKRLEFATDRMNYDIAVGVLEQKPDVFYSSDYLQLKYYAVAKSTKEAQLESVTDLQKYSVGAWPYAWKYLGEEYRKLYSPKSDGTFAHNYTEPNTSESQNKMFWHNRFDVSITNKVIFNYYKKQLSNEIDTNPEVLYYDIIPNEVKLSVAFKDLKVRDEFENGLNQLKRNKRFRRIFDSYIK